MRVTNLVANGELILYWLQDNFSFVGSFRPLSKIVVIIVMIRGRHRGLPLAIDRASA
jgi:Trk-type K+ transport system membrane component